MPSDQAISLHLSLFNKASSNMTVFSGFIAALRDARKFTSRDQKTGEKLSTQSPLEQEFGDLGSWLGAIGYMTLLDQIGTCFKPITSTVVNGSTIIKALRYFTALPEKECDAIYALRCAFAHDYSLYNINNKRPSLTHHFHVCKSPTIPVVTLPNQQWNGVVNNKNQLNKTTINLEAVGDLVEEICSRLFDLANESNLEVTLQGGTDELIQRYSFFAINDIET